MSTHVSRNPRWERRKEQRPAELVDAALDLFVEHGYAATRLDDVAARAGVSKGTLYLYFAGKEDLFKAVIRETIVPLIDERRRDVEASEANCAALLESYFHDWWKHFGCSKASGICKLIVAEAANFPDLARFFAEEVVGPNDRVLATILERGIARGEFRPVDVDAAVRVWMAPLVLKVIWLHSVGMVCSGPNDVGIERFLEVHTRLALSALGVPPERP